MIYALIGHRGVGKTSLLKRIQKYRPDAYVFCLDERIEELHGPIRLLFRDKGEEGFRKIEHDVFVQMMSRVENEREDVFISVGAGFSEELPKNVRKIWIRREVDLGKHVFLNRPSLNPNPTLLAMPKDIFTKRDQNYARLADEELMLPEGEYSFLPEEKKFFTKTIKNIGGVLTLLPWQLDKNHFESWIADRDGWGLQAFEMRNDLLTTEQIRRILQLNLRTPLLFSFRQIRNLDVELQLALKCSLIDWDMTLVDAPAIVRERCFYSYHSDETTFAADLKKMRATREAVKWSPLITSWMHLELGHEWVMESPQTRAFLPRSSDGRWSWYRRLMKTKMLINFLREGKGSAADQPSLVDWMSMDEHYQEQSALLGAPVRHSWSPVYHRGFFNDLGMNIFAIHLHGENANQRTVDFLFRLGFRAFAVTSPLKTWAAQLVEADQGINTLVWSKRKKTWRGHSTDMVGFESQLAKAAINMKTLQVAIWGSGSMADSIREKYPQSIVFSARSGEPVTPAPEGWMPQVLVWASGDLGEEILTVKYPQWRPIWFVDLNYRQDSPAISFAHRWGARYVSGADMFYGQAHEQQKHWKEELKR